MCINSGNQMSFTTQVEEKRRRICTKLAISLFITLEETCSPVPCERFHCIHSPIKNLQVVTVWFSLSRSPKIESKRQFFKHSFKRLQNKSISQLPVKFVEPPVT